MTRDLVWLDGELVPASTATVSAFDHGLTVGDGVFETMAVTRGQAFALRRHLARLDRSALALGLVPPDHGLLRDAVASVIDANGSSAGRIRVTLTGGTSPLGSQRGDDTPTLIVAAAPLHPPAPTADVVTVEWRRNERGALAGLKTTSYGENVRALAVAQAAGADEAIFANTVDLLCEGTGTNIFLVHDGSLVTPTLSSGCLAGVTRELVLEVTDAAEVDLPVTTLAAAPEAFLTSSTRDVQAIAHVDRRRLGGAPGPLTAAAARAFAELVADDLDP